MPVLVRTVQNRFRNENMTLIDSLERRVDGEL
jgi:hypothetical protein